MGIKQGGKMAKKNQTWLFVGIIVVAIAAIFFYKQDSTGPKSGADSSKPTRIPIHNWSSQVVMARVIGGIIEDMGGSVEYVPADSQKVYESIRIGDVDISHGVWQSAFGKSFDAARDKGGLLDWGDHVARSLEDMGYPNWVADKGLCPGLPDWEAMKAEACWKNFVTPDSGGKGRWLEGPQTWHQDLMPQRLTALGLDANW